MIEEYVITAMIKGNQEEFEQIRKEEESKLSQSDKQKLAHYQEFEREANEISAQIKQQEDEGQKNILNQELTQLEQKAQKLFPEIQPLVLDIYKKAKKRFYEKHKGEIDSEFERIKKQINEWEKEGTKVGSK
jgi:argininosuccinate lyase